MFFACELWVKRVGTLSVVLYRNQLPVNFILHSAELHIVSSIRYQNAIYGNYFLNCSIVKRILISFNCFSEYIIKQVVSYLFRLQQSKMIGVRDESEVRLFLGIRSMDGCR